jgi:trk system potassium uptake protein TrkH
MGTLAVFALVGRMVMLFALLMLLPLAFAVIHDDAAKEAFVHAIGITVLVGIALRDR